MKAAAIIVAAGQGKRMGRPKQFMPLSGKPLVDWSVEAFLKLPQIVEVVMVLSPQQMKEHHGDWKGKPVRVVEGGETRLDSVRRGFFSLSQIPEVVAVHDGARPLVTSQVVEDCLKAAQNFGAAVPAVPVHDTLKEVSADLVVHQTPDRSRFWSAQTPQCYQGKVLAFALKKFENVKDASDESQLVERSGVSVKVVPSIRENIKITTPSDLIIAEAFLRKNQPPTPSTAPSRSSGTIGASERRDEFRVPAGAPALSAELRVPTGAPEESSVLEGPSVLAPSPQPLTKVGFGYDIHRLVSGRDLFLGGVKVPHAKGLLGHSDGDVILHAVGDAVLGALGEGEIGQYFPPSDPEIKGIPSSKIMEKVLEKLRDKEGRILHLDVTLVAEEPRLASFYPKLKASLCKIMKLPAERINIKAKSQEGLGEIGQGQAIACYAVASIVSAQ